MSQDIFLLFIKRFHLFLKMDVCKDKVTVWQLPVNLISPSPISAAKDFLSMLKKYPVALPISVVLMSLSWESGPTGYKGAQNGNTYSKI